MASAMAELQKLQYAQLSTISVGADKIFDGVAPVGEAGPFVIIGQDNALYVGTKSNEEWQVTSRFTIHSDLASFNECKDIAGEILTLFNEKTFDIPPYKVYGVRAADEAYSIEEIGLTRRGDADYTFWITN